MQFVNTIELLEELKKISPDGFEVFTKHGLLTSTKAIYFHKGLVFFFQMEFDFCFDLDFGLTVEEFKMKYKNWIWKIEQVIS
jgi:hypothetical protein